MLAGDIKDEVRYGIDDISRRGLRMSDDGGDGGSGGRKGGGRRGSQWRLAGGGRGGGGQGFDLFSLLFAWLDMLAGLAGAVLAVLRRM